MIQPVVGIDFDNTIVSYDDVFYNVALEQKLIPVNTPKNKESVRNCLRACGKEDSWIKLQGYVYGSRMREAVAFPAVKDFLVAAIQKNMKVYIISHKTRHPYKGPRYDLHQAALDWLDYNGFFDPNHIALDRDQVFFEASLDEKVKRINYQQCMYFIDDLPEVFSHENYPNSVHKILFQPNGLLLKKDNHTVISSWRDISSHLFEEKNERA
jgi:hypothetical protein